MPAGATYEPIATTTVSGTGTNLVTFSSIPATYTDIVLVVSGSLTTGSADCKVRFNNDSGTNYSRTFMFGNGTSAISDRNSNLSGIYVINFNSSQINNSILHIMNYANTTTYKTVVGRNNTTNVAAYVCLWRSTSAINRFDISPDSGNWSDGTVLTIYGIAAA